MADNTPVMIQPQPSSSPTYTALQIGPGTITGSQVAENTILGENIAEDTITSDNIEAGSITAESIEAGTITGDKIHSLEITGKTIIVDTGTIGGWTLGSTSLIGPAGAIIRSGQTDFDVGTGFYLANVAGTPKFSVGTAAGNKMSWDGTNLRITGSFTPTTVFNTYTYVTADLPIPPTTAGFNDPSAVE